MDIQIRLLTWFRGRLMGTDKFGNRYYQNKSSKRPVRRWVLYHGKAEASHIPPLWRAWLQRTAETPPTDYQAHYGWEKPHQPNLTGTVQAYHPQQQEPTQTRTLYQPWSPDITKTES